MTISMNSSSKYPFILVTWKSCFIELIAQCPRKFKRECNKLEGRIFSWSFLWYTCIHVCIYIWYICINVNLDRVRIERCDQTKYLEESNINMWDDINAKNMIIKMLSENINKITSSFNNSNDTYLLTKHQQN